MIVKEISYSPSDATLDSQIAALKASGANTFFNFSIGSLATQAIRTAYDLGWHPLQFIPNASLSVAAFLDPAGLEKSAGIITNAKSKGWLEPPMRADPEVREFVDWMREYNPQASLRDQNNVAGYERAEALIEVLKKMRRRPDPRQRDEAGRPSRPANWHVAPRNQIPHHAAGFPAHSPILPDAV